MGERNTSSTSSPPTGKDVEMEIGYCLFRSVFLSLKIIHTAKNDDHGSKTGNTKFNLRVRDLEKTFLFSEKSGKIISTVKPFFKSI